VVGSIYCLLANMYIVLASEVSTQTTPNRQQDAMDENISPIESLLDDDWKPTQVSDVFTTITVDALTRVDNRKQNRRRRQSKCKFQYQNIITMLQCRFITTTITTKTTLITYKTKGRHNNNNNKSLTTVML
jgi:hypothetical protein